MSAQKFVYAVQQWSTQFDVIRVPMKDLRNVRYYDWDAEEEREDPKEFAIDNPDQSLDMLIDEDPEEGEFCQSVEVFSTRELAQQWARLMYMWPNRDERKDAPYIWRQRVGFCD